MSQNIPARPGRKCRAGILALFLLVSLCTPLWAEESVLTLKAGNELITLHKREGTWVSKECLAGQCLALQAPEAHHYPEGLPNLILTDPRTGFSDHDAAKLLR